MKRVILLLLVSMIFIFNSCIKEMDVFIPDPGQVTGPDSVWYSSITVSMPVVTLKKNLSLTRDIDSIQNDMNSSFISASGLQCKIDSGAFVDDGGLMVAGKIAIETNLLISNGDFIRMSNPTNSGDTSMISAGAFFVNATKDGKQLNLAKDKKITVQYHALNNLPKLNLYNGDDSNIDKFKWTLNTDTSQGINKITAIPNAYEITVNKLHWMNCQYPFDSAGAKYTNISLTLPPTFTNSNTVAYLVFNEQNVVSRIYGNSSTKTFLSNKIPVGKPVTVVTITKEGNLYYLGSQNFITGPAPQPGNNTFQKISIDPKRQSLSAIKQFLSGI